MAWSFAPCDFTPKKGARENERSRSLTVYLLPKFYRIRIVSLDGLSHLWRRMYMQTKTVSNRPHAVRSCTRSCQTTALACSHRRCSESGRPQRRAIDVRVPRSRRGSRVGTTPQQAMKCPAMRGVPPSNPKCPAPNTVLRKTRPILGSVPLCAHVRTIWPLGVDKRECRRPGTAKDDKLCGSSGAACCSLLVTPDKPRTGLLHTQTILHTQTR